MSDSASTSEGHLSSYMKDEVGLDDEPDKNGTDSVVVTEDALSVSVPRWLSLKKRKLVLHVDLNNTILVSDAVTGQGTVAALEYFLSSVTWGRVTKRGQWEWTSDVPSLLPPHEGAVSYYSQFGRVAGFTRSPDGRRFRGFLEEHLDLLRWPEGRGAEPELAVTGEDGRLYHWILPSFFQLLRDLVEEGRDFAVLFRTFGSDLPRVLTAMSRALTQGRHPLFPDLPDLQVCGCDPVCVL
ncbi:uncharacterized protein si:dkey-32e6.3 [Osmerus mordax]|uniref:uncharacterized protein si:dkey-32e6.3 n=1 Tax=Osmerus mordax TaxID=8014 RepID=UPI00350F26FF